MTGECSNQIVGTDGCPFGYVSLMRGTGIEWQWHLHDSVETWWRAFERAEATVLDLMLGLCDPQRPRRACDAAARRLVGGSRACVVYSAPARAALASATYAEACEMNRTAVGRGVSQQCFALFGKIRETDQLLERHATARAHVREGHPEVLFALANGGHAMRDSKKDAAGYTERISVLRRLLPNAEHLIAAGLKKFRRADVGRDDLVDAAILAVAADAGAQHGFCGIADQEADARGINMNIYYPSRFALS